MKFAVNERVRLGVDYNYRQVKFAIQTTVQYELEPLGAQNRPTALYMTGE
jgi:hypothetical protein